MVDRRLNRTHKPRTHINALRTQRQRRCEALPVRETPRRNKRHTQTLPRPAQQDEIGDIMLPNVARTLETVNRQEIHAELNSALRVADRGALVQHDAVVLLDVFDDGTRRVAGCLDDADAFFDGNAGIGTVVGRVHGGQEGDVDAEGLGGLGLGFADFFAQVFGRGLREGCELYGKAGWVSRLEDDGQSVWISLTMPRPPALETADASSA